MVRKKDDVYAYGVLHDNGYVVYSLKHNSLCTSSELKK